MLQQWHTNIIALLIVVALAVKWWMAKAIDLTDFQNVIGLLAAAGFIAAKDGNK